MSTAVLSFLLIRRYHGLARGSNERKKKWQVHEPKAAFTRRDPSVRNVAGRPVRMGSRVVVVLVKLVCRCVAAGQPPDTRARAKQ